MTTADRMVGPADLRYGWTDAGPHTNRGPRKVTVQLKDDEAAGTVELTVAAVRQFAIDFGPEGSCDDPLGVRFDFAAGRWDGDATRCWALDEDLPTVCAFADDRAFMEFLGHLLRCVVLAETLDRLDAEEFDR